MLRWLYKWLSSSLPHADTDVISDAIADVFVKYRKKPEAFDSHCGVPLEFYLLYAAARRVSKLLEGGEAQRTREYPLAKCA